MCVLTSSASRADLVIVDAAADLEIRRDNKFLVTLAQVVAFGKPVLPKASWKLPRPDCSPDIVRHQPAMRTRRRLVCSPEFQNKHKITYQALKECAAAEGSKWSVVVEGSEAEAAEEGVARQKKKKRHRDSKIYLRSSKDVHVFLHNARRLQRPRALGGTFGRPS